MENEKTQRYQACNSRNKELFGIIAKFSYNKIFLENVEAVEMKRTQILINKPVYLGLSIREINKMAMYKFWCDHVKPNSEKKKNYVTWILRASQFTSKSAKDVETRFDTLNNQADHYLKEKIKK